MGPGLCELMYALGTVKSMQDNAEEPKGGRGLKAMTRGKD